MSEPLRLFVIGTYRTTYYEHVNEFPIDLAIRLTPTIQSTNDVEYLFREKPEKPKNP